MILLVREINLMNELMFSLIVDLLSSSITNQTIESNSIINARILYSSCMNEDAIESEGVDRLISFINTELGGWPILQGLSWDESTFNLTRLLIKLNQYRIFIFFNVLTYIDENNSLAYSIYVSLLLNIYFD